MSTKRTIAYLKLASGIIIGFGLLGFLGVWPLFAAPIKMLLDLIFWPVDANQSLAAPESSLLLAVASGVLVGWGAMMWLIATRLYQTNAELSRTIIMTGITLWFVIDSTGSIIAGAPLNALFNLGFVALFYLPLRHIPKSITSNT
ncbi:MAG: hypothetical protein ABJO09_15865 [Hyphomicrobiales bacterium]